MSEETKEPPVDRVTFPRTSILKELAITNPDRLAEISRQAGHLAASDSTVAGACTAMISGQQLYNAGAFALNDRCRSLNMSDEVVAVLIQGMRDAAGKPFKREEVMMTLLRKIIPWISLLVVDERVAALLPEPIDLVEDEKTEQTETEESSK